MATTSQLYGREGNIVINGIRFTPKMRYDAHCDICGKKIPESDFQSHEINYSKTKRGSEIYLCDKCFCQNFNISEAHLADMRKGELC